mmetsp:Transcript_18546/g.43614  ORF Transcript_18546/g.43614 Transcript_18546/m.43614 type:complete len:94 (+) Transcript_18546:791-1072(+)
MVPCLVSIPGFCHGGHEWQLTRTPSPTPPRRDELRQHEPQANVLLGSKGIHQQGDQGPDTGLLEAGSRRVMIEQLPGGLSVESRQPTSMSRGP